jgi:hypothetical protein
MADGIASVVGDSKSVGEIEIGIIGKEGMTGLTYLRLGLKAQSQCRATLETLAAIKNPRPVAFVQQANYCSWASES